VLAIMASGGAIFLIGDAISEPNLRLSNPQQCDLRWAEAVQKMTGGSLTITIALSVITLAGVFACGLQQFRSIVQHRGHTFSNIPN